MNTHKSRRAVVFLQGLFFQALPDCRQHLLDLARSPQALQSKPPARISPTPKGPPGHLKGTVKGL